MYSFGQFAAATESPLGFYHTRKLARSLALIELATAMVLEIARHTPV
jgi:hypothetical protein